MGDNTLLPMLDRSIKRSSEDLLDRRSFALIVADALMQDNQEGATVVGISGAWGTGKSSVAEMVIEQLESKATVVRFDPWMVSAREILTAEFFNVLGKAVFPKVDLANDKKKRARFYKYASKSLGVLSSVGTVAGGIIPGAYLAAKGVEQVGKVLETAAQGLEALANEPTLREARDEIARDLQSLKQPILVVIDDIDRLDRNEVRIMLQLVKSIADFPNVRYLLLYDQEQIVDALSSFVHSPGAFLEKIINQAFDLPEATTQQRTKLLDDYLTELNLHENLHEKTMERLSSAFLNILLPGLPTLRHIKRYVATVRALVPGVIKDGHRNVDPADFLVLEFVRQYAPGVYTILRQQDGPVIGGNFARLFEPKKWAEKMDEERKEAIDLIQNKELQKLLVSAMSSLGVQASVSTSATDFMDRRFSCDAWRPVYFGFDESRASVSQAKWKQFLVSLSRPETPQTWLADWNDQSKRDEWVAAITSRVAEIPWDESLHLLTILFRWGDQQEQEETRLESTKISWEFAVRHCTDAIMSVTPDNLDPVKEISKVVAASGSIVTAGYCIGSELDRETRGRWDRWSRDSKLKSLVQPMRKKLRKAMDNESIWEFKDVSTAIAACHYLVEKDFYQAWWNSFPTSELRLINYIEKDLAKSPKFNYRFEKGALLDSITALDPGKLSDAGKATRLLVIRSGRDIYERNESLRRPILE